jgi:hypothetical protein
MIGIATKKPTEMMADLDAVIEECRILELREIEIDGFKVRNESLCLEFRYVAREIADILCRFAGKILLKSREKNEWKSSPDQRMRSNR